MSQTGSAPTPSAWVPIGSIVKRTVLFSIVGGMIAGAAYGALVALISGFADAVSTGEFSMEEVAGTFLFAAVSILYGAGAGLILGGIAALFSGVAVVVTAELRHRRVAGLIVGASASLAGWLLLWGLAAALYSTLAEWIWPLAAVHIALALAIVPVYMSMLARVERGPRPGASARLEVRARLRPMRIATRWIAPVFGAAYLLVGDPLGLEPSGPTGGVDAFSVGMLVLFGAIGGSAIAWLLLAITSALLSRRKPIGPVTVGFIVGAAAALSVVVVHAVSIAEAGDRGASTAWIAALIAGAGIAWASWGSASGRCLGAAQS